MTAYGFDFIRADGSIYSVSVDEFATTLDALREARRALTGCMTAVGVDVWSGERRVARVGEPAPALS